MWGWGIWQLGGVEEAWGGVRVGPLQTETGGDIIRVYVKNMRSF